MRAGWHVDREKVVDALWEVVRTKDPELMLEATKLLLLADGLNIKREELELKQKTREDEQRLRLLALARSVPVAELTRIASENGIVSGNGQG